MKSHAKFEIHSRWPEYLAYAKKVNFSASLDCPF